MNGIAIFPTFLHSIVPDAILNEWWSMMIFATIEDNVKLVCVLGNFSLLRIQWDKGKWFVCFILQILKMFPSSWVSSIWLCTKCQGGNSFGSLGCLDLVVWFYVFWFCHPVRELCECLWFPYVFQRDKCFAMKWNIG